VACKNNKFVVFSRQVAINLPDKFEDSPLSSPTGRQSVVGASPMARTPSGNQLKKLFKECHIGRSSSFRKLLEPSLSDKPGITPYRIVLGNVKEKVRIDLSYLLENK
jgi:phosphoenolpyruvate carboxylase